MIAAPALPAAIALAPSSVAPVAAVVVTAVVVASRDEADPGHPYAVGERYAREIPGAELLSEEPGSSPLAWQGGQLSKVIAELAARVGGGGAGRFEAARIRRCG